jgi:hypothetical protein
MTTNRMPFMPLNVDDEKLERLAAEKGVGKFEKPAQERREGAVPSAIQITAPAPANTPEADEKTTPNLKTVNLELPAYVWTELKIRAAHQQTSLKHVIMKALLADGITIQDADMIEDGRRLRGSNRR